MQNLKKGAPKNYSCFVFLHKGDKKAVSQDKMARCILVENELIVLHIKYDDVNYNSKF